MMMMKLGWMGVKIGESKGYAINRFMKSRLNFLRKEKNTIVVKVSDYSGGGGMYGNADDMYIKTA